MSPLPPVLYKVVLLTSRHSISGQVELGQQRLSDMLNDRRESLVFVHGATIARLANPGKPCGKYSLTAIPKSAVVLAFDLEPQAIPADKRFYSYIQKKRHPVFMIADHLEVLGTAHSAGALDLHSFNPTGETTFIPLTDAIVTFEDGPYRIQQPAVLVNLRHVQSISPQEEESSGKTPRKEDRT